MQDKTDFEVSAPIKETDFDTDWYVSEHICKQCNVYMWVSDWWDDSHEDGGVVIGEYVRCGNCDFEDSY